MSTCDSALTYRMKGLMASLIELRRYSKRSLVSFLEILSQSQLGFTFAGIFPLPDSDV